jgi:hypothetical protein
MPTVDDRRTKRPAIRSSSLIVVLVLGGIIVLIAWSFHRATPVTVVSSRLERSGDIIFIEGRLRNTSSDPTAIDVEVHYYDSAGRTLGQNKVSIAEIPAGGVADFRTPSITLDGVADFSIYLNNGRNPYGN